MLFRSFHIHLIDKKGENKIYEFNNLNLNPDSQDFIGRVIGTARKYYDHDIKRIVEEGDYAIQNPWIRVEISEQVINLNKNIDKDFTSISDSELSESSDKTDKSDNLDFEVIN